MKTYGNVFYSCCYDDEYVDKSNPINIGKQELDKLIDRLFLEYTSCLGFFDSSDNTLLFIVNEDCSVHISVSIPGEKGWYVNTIEEDHFLELIDSLCEPYINYIETEGLIFEPFLEKEENEPSKNENKVKTETESGNDFFGYKFKKQINGITFKFNELDIQSQKKLTVRSREMGFYGEYNKSPNEKYLLFWSMGSNYDHGAKGGIERINGKFMLIDGEKIIAKGNLDSPIDGNVSNDGRFVINDSLHEKEFPGGIFLAFDHEGKELLRKNFSANLNQNSISKDGKHAICQMMGSKTADSQTIAFFDLDKKEMLWQKVPETGSAESIRIDSEKEVIWLKHHWLGEYSYSFSGEFIDKNNWDKNRIEHSDGWYAFQVAEERYSNHKLNCSRNELMELLEIYLIASNKIQSKDISFGPYKKGLAESFRRIGEIYFFLDDKEKSISFLEKALGIDSKVGAKKLLKNIKSSLS